MRQDILIVDDEAAIRDLLTDALVGEGYAVTTAADGVEALHRIAESVPAVVLLDLNMPRLDGVGVVRALRERGVSVPVVLLSAAPNAGRWARRLGAVASLGKPFDLAALLALVARVLAADGQAGDVA